MDGDRPAVKAKPRMERNRVLVTGGAGFVGSHLCEYLVKRGDHVICVDNLFTGSKDNVAHLLKEPNFELIRHDVVEPILLEIDQVRLVYLCPRYTHPSRSYRLLEPSSSISSTPAPTHLGFSLSWTIGLPLGVPCQPGPLQVQPDQDDEDWIHRHDEHAGPRQALQGKVPSHQHKRGVRCVCIDKYLASIARRTPHTCRTSPSIPDTETHSSTRKPRNISGTSTASANVVVTMRASVRLSA